MNDLGPIAKTHQQQPISKAASNLELYGFEPHNLKTTIPYIQKTGTLANPLDTNYPKRSDTIVTQHPDPS